MMLSPDHHMESQAQLEQIIAITRLMISHVDEGSLDKAIAQLPLRQALLEQFVEIAIDRSHLSMDLRERVDELREYESELRGRLERDKDQMYAASTALRALDADPYRQQLSDPVVLDRHA